MKRTEQHDYRHSLLAIATRLQADTAGMAEQAHGQSGGNGGSELSNAPLHLGDMGTEEYMYDMNTTLLANEQYIAGEVREALRRLDDGTFGTCMSCQLPIGKERLQEIPYTRFCVECAATNDETLQVNFNDGRPRSPEDTLAPEGEMQEDRHRRTDPLETPRPQRSYGDVYAAGTAGGGTAVGGLAGSNEGNGEPVITELDEATGSGNFDIDDDRPDDITPQSGFTGGAVGGTPARKRAK